MTDQPDAPGLPALPELPELPQTVTTDRLLLPLMSPELADDALAGRRHPDWHRDFPREDDLDAASLVRSGSSWGPRLFVRRADRLVVGGVGFFGPPDPASDGVPETEVGYGLVAEARGAGLATEALLALLAETDRRGVRVRASVEPTNAASLRVLAKCGFTEVRGPNEDGDLVLARPLPRLVS
jgi:RimJ/RimL family protein N-acetyltransferase